MPTMLATIKEVRFDKDGGGRVVLEISADSEAPAVKILPLRGQVVSVTVEPCK